MQKGPGNMWFRKVGRVDEGSFLPPSPTEPLVRISRKRLLVVVASLRDC
jgi:hypothetical protein